MSIAIAKKKRGKKLVLGPDSAGIVLTPAEFDRAEFEDGWRYELVYGVLLVTPVPLDSEIGPNEQLGRLLLNYQEDHPNGKALDGTLSERNVKIGPNRRRADRVLWAGLGRRPERDETPTIIVEFVSRRKRDRERDYRTKRVEYRQAGVKEYWVVDRFLRTMTVFARGKKPRVIAEKGIDRTDILPGFELPLAKLLKTADYWTVPDAEDKS